MGMHKVLATMQTFGNEETMLFTMTASLKITKQFAYLLRKRREVVLRCHKGKDTT